MGTTPDDPRPDELHIGGSVPRGVEVLVKKASVDPEFRTLLLSRRAAAAAEIGLELTPSEAAMLDSVPAEQLEAIIARTKVPEEHRRVFLGNVGKSMLAVVAGVGGVVVVGSVLSLGIRPGRRPRRLAPDTDRDEPSHAGGSDDDVEESAHPESDRSAPPSLADPDDRERIPVTKGARPDLP